MRRLAALSVLAAAGCAPAIHLPEPDIAVPPAFEAQSASPDVNSVSLDRWWDDFNDPQLSSLVTTSLERSTTARLAYARIVEARAVRSQTRASTLPTGGLSAVASRQGSEPLWGDAAGQSASNSYQAAFSPSWEIDLFGRLATIRDRASLDYHGAALDFFGARLALAGDVAVSLFQARFLALQLSDARERLRIATELTTSGALGHEHGLTSRQDLARLQADAASGEAEVVRLEAELTTAKRSLLILIGDPAAATDTLLIEPVLDAPPALPALTPGLALARRPDVRAARIGLQSATRTIEIDRLALFPRFSLQADAGVTAMGSASDGLGLWSLVAGVAAPVLDRAALLAALRISEARGLQAVITYERAVQAAFGEAENTLTLVAAGQRRVEQLERAAREARFAYDAARRGYASGLTDLTTLLQVESVWLQNRSALNAGRLSLLTDTVAAIRALGGGWTPGSELAPEPAELSNLGK